MDARIRDAVALVMEDTTREMRQKKHSWEDGPGKAIPAYPYNTPPILETWLTAMLAAAKHHHLMAERNPRPMGESLSDRILSDVMFQVQREAATLGLRQLVVAADAKADVITRAAAEVAAAGVRKGWIE